MFSASRNSASVSSATLLANGATLIPFLGASKTRPNISLTSNIKLPSKPGFILRNFLACLTAFLVLFLISVSLPFKSP